MDGQGRPVEGKFTKRTLSGIESFYSWQIDYWRTGRCFIRFIVRFITAISNRSAGRGITFQAANRRLSELNSHNQVLLSVILALTLTARVSDHPLLVGANRPSINQRNHSVSESQDLSEWVKRRAEVCTVLTQIESTCQLPLPQEESSTERYWKMLEHLHRETSGRAFSAVREIIGIVRVNLQNGF